MRWFPAPVNLPLQGMVDAAGELALEFGPTYDQAWQVMQVSLQMRTAPVGAEADIFYGPTFVTGANSARRATAGGDPPIHLQPGEKMSVVWTGCTPGDLGEILVVYRKGVY